MRGRRIGMLLACVALACAGGAVAAGPAAAVEPADTLTYMPFGFVHNEHPAAVREESLAQLQGYGIGQMLLPLPNFNATGVLKLTRIELRTLPAWLSSTAAYNAAHATDITPVASFGGRVTRTSLKLEETSVRANMLAGIEQLLGMGFTAISLDLEPYPTTHGFVLLLEEIDAALARRGLAGRVAVTAPATVGRWSQPYMREVTSLLGQVDPLFYDSERKTAAAYEQWVREGLAAYSQGSAPSALIIPDLPSYGTNKWHDPAVENLGTATTAVEEALAEGRRVNGAGIFWWWGFYYEEEGAYNAAADREAWTDRTLLVPFTP